VDIGDRVYYKLLANHLSSGTEVNHEASPPKWTVPGLIPEARTSRIRCRCAAHFALKERMKEGIQEETVLIESTKLSSALGTILHSLHRNMSVFTYGF
jgi:hypothetical protein